MKHQYKEK